MRCMQGGSGGAGGHDSEAEMRRGGDPQVNEAVAVTVRPRTGWQTVGKIVRVVTLAAVVGLLLFWRPALRLLGAALVAEDGLATADVIVVSTSSAVCDALEAARLFRDGYAPRILVPGTTPEPYLDDVHALGIPQLSGAELTRAVLQRSGVPEAAIEVGPDEIDGTSTEARAIAAFARQRRPGRLIVVTARSHGARTRWLLRDLLPPGTGLIVRGARCDPFAADSWWRSRDESRDVLMEYGRWANTLLGDLWGSRADP